MFLLTERVAKLKRTDNTDMEPSEEAPEKLTNADCLRSWGLEMYIDKFNELAIDLETLQMLSDADLKDLVPVIGHRAKLSIQIKLLKDIMANAFIAPNSTQESVVPSNNTLDDANVMLYEYTLQGVNVTKPVTDREVTDASAIS